MQYVLTSLLVFNNPENSISMADKFTRKFRKFLRTTLPLLILFSGKVSVAGTKATVESPESWPFVVNSATLGNGLRIYHVQNPRAPLVYNVLCYRVGSADEDQGNSGYAHLFEHLMFKLTTNRRIEFGKVIESLGGRSNAHTSYDRTCYNETLPIQHLETAMAMEADRMFNLVLDDSVVIPERNVVLEERSQRTDNDPTRKFQEQLNAILFLNHRYKTPIIGWRHEIEQMTAKAAMNFYNRWYTPHNAYAVIVSQNKWEDVLAMAQRQYGKLPNKENTATRSRPMEPPQLARRTLQMVHEQVQQSRMERSCLVPNSRVQAPELNIANQAIAYSLSAGPFSRLHSKLVRQEKLVLSIEVDSETLADYDVVGWVAIAPPQSDLKKIEQRIEMELESIAKFGLTEAELAQARIAQLDAVELIADGYENPGYLILGLLSDENKIEELASLPNTLLSLTNDHIKTAARTFWLENKACVTGILEPKPPTAATQEKITTQPNP